GVDEPHELGPVLGGFTHRFVADHEEIALEERHDGVTEAGERRVIVPASQQPRVRLVGDVEDHRAAVDVPDVGAVGTARIDVGVVRAIAGIDGRVARRSRLGVAVPRPRQPPAPDFARPRRRSRVSWRAMPSPTLPKPSSGWCASSRMPAGMSVLSGMRFPPLGHRGAPRVSRGAPSVWGLWGAISGPPTSYSRSTCAQISPG